MTFLANMLIAATVIAFVSWLSGRAPVLAGWIAALPLSTMLILPMAQAEHANAENTVLLARNIFVATPVTLLFFVPFLFADQLELSFEKLYGLGCACLVFGFGLYRLVARAFLSPPG